MTSIPANMPAEQISRLRSENNDLTTQIEDLVARRTSNEAIILAFEPLAEWEEFDEPTPGIPDEVVPEATDAAADQAILDEEVKDAIPDE